MKKAILLIVLIIVIIGGIFIAVKYNNDSSKENTIEQNKTVEPTNVTAETSQPTDTNITTDKAEQLLIKKFGSKDEKTGNIMSYGYVATVQDKQGNKYYAFRQSWLVDNSHMSFLQNAFVSLDGKIIKTSATSMGFEENQVVEFDEN